MRPADCVIFHVHVNLRKATKKRRAESLNPFEICEATVFAREWSKSLPVLSANNPINSGQLMQRSSEFSEASGLSALLKRFRAHSPNPSPQPTAHKHSPQPQATAMTHSPQPQPTATAHSLQPTAHSHRPQPQPRQADVHNTCFAP